MLYQLSYEATHWEWSQLTEFISSSEERNDVKFIWKFIWNNSYMNCSCRRKWRMIILYLQYNNVASVYSEKSQNQIPQNFSCLLIRRHELNQLTSLPMCGFIAQLVEHRTVSQRSRVCIPLKPWFFQASSFQLLKLENLLQWSFFTFIYNRSSYMNYFI